ncbi:hypothetical protein BDA96_09G192800 [Sorghum bicolor]|uniref:Uncharacterized protein n=1 Tax=Sorghum bicolor TaxID=4558 RepID=A0A921QBE4_SORBI|nr:hypothetical protein BDA96_09G192800 [Sorghum bicolor]
MAAIWWGSMGWAVETSIGFVCCPVLVKKGEMQRIPRRPKVQPAGCIRRAMRRCYQRRCVRTAELNSSENVNYKQHARAMFGPSTSERPARAYNICVAKLTSVS